MIPAKRRIIARASRGRRAIGVLASITLWSGLAAYDEPGEHELKAAAVSNLVAFTEWPASAFQTPDAPLVIGVLGRGPVAGLLAHHLANETWQGRKITVRQMAAAGDARSCHAIYISPSEMAAWRGVASQFARASLLTISDAENFARDGGIVQLAFERNELRLIVNVAVARECGLTISSKVLRLARVVDQKP
jgi:hypothetical protein